MSATLVKLASSHRLTPVVGFDEKSGFILRFTQADGIKPHALSRHTKDSHFVPRWGECSLSLAFAFSDFSISAFSLWLHRADAWHRARHRHGSARARPDSPDFRPLHSATRTARRLRGRFAAFRRIGNYRDRRERACAARSRKISEAAMLRISAKPSNSP